MTAHPKRHTGPPPSAGVLARHAQAYARELGVAEGRVRAWVAYMIMAGTLERADGPGGPRFIVKGGVALELRLRGRARATKDIDIVLRDTTADLAEALEQATARRGVPGVLVSAARVNRCCWTTAPSTSSSPSRFEASPGPA